MEFTRREFIRGGVSAFTLGFAAPAFLSDLARAQGASRRCLVVLYLSGGNDALSTIVPYTDPFYRSRRPSIQVLPGTEIQIGSDISGKPLALHPRLTGLKQIFDAGDLAIINRTGYPNSSRSHFTGTDIWNTAAPNAPVGSGWLGRYLDLLSSPGDPLAGWVTGSAPFPRAVIGNEVSVPQIPDPRTYAFATPNPSIPGEAQFARVAMTSIASHLPAEQPHLAFVNGTAQAALATLDKVNSVGTYNGTVTYGGDGLSQAFRWVAGAITRGIGTKVFWVQTGGYDTHATQNVNGTTGYGGLMITLNNAVTTFYNDMRNQGLLNDVTMLQFSEFGRRISENTGGANAGTDHGAAGIMMAIGGSVNGGIFGTAPNLQPVQGNTTLENNFGDVTYESDFRSVYAKVLENWLGVNSVPILNGNFTQPSMPLSFI